MAEQICRRCNQLLAHDDLVKAEVVAKFVGLKSKSIYALSKPTECLWLEHRFCQYPKGDMPDGD